MYARRAKGKKSVAISARSGFKVPYRSLKTTWDGLRVEPEEWEPKHPQLTPAKNVIDATDSDGEDEDSNDTAASTEGGMATYDALEFFEKLRNIDYEGDLIIQGAREDLDGDIPVEKTCSKYLEFINRYLEKRTE